MIFALALASMLAQAAAKPAAAEPPVPGAALTAALRSVKQDGEVKLTPEAQADIHAMMPKANKGEECSEPPVVSAEVLALKDRGDGPVAVVGILSCKGARIFAFGLGTPVRVARLLDVSESTVVRKLVALNLGGGRRELDLGLELFTSPTSSELRLFTRRENGFAFSEGGTLHEFTSIRECAAGNEEGGGWASFVRPGKTGLEVLRTDESCSGAPWQAGCILWRLERDTLSRSGVCALPPRLDAKALHASGWR